MSIFNKNKTDEIEKLMDVAFSNGMITENNKEVLFRKADKLGIDHDEFEMILNNRIDLENKKLSEKPSESPSESFEDGYNISNQELLHRTQKWVNLVVEKSYEGKVEELPVQKSESELLSFGKKMAKSVTGAVGSTFKSKLSFVNPINYLKLATQIAGGLDKDIKLKHPEIVEIADFYLILLEQRSESLPSNELLNKKFNEYQSTYKSNIDLYNSNNNSKLKKLFS